MGDYTRPGVYIEETTPGPAKIQGASTSITGFFGFTTRGPVGKTQRITSLDEFIRVYGGAEVGLPLYYSVRSFFENGGVEAHVGRAVHYTDPTDPTAVAGTPAAIVFNNLSGTAALSVVAGYRGAASPGEFGNRLSVSVSDDPLMPSNGAGNDLAANASAGDLVLTLKTVKGLFKGSILKLDEGGTTEYCIITDINSTVSGGAVVHTVQIETALSNAFTAAGATVNSVEHTIRIYLDDSPAGQVFKQVSMNPGSPVFVDAIVNDPVTGSTLIAVASLGLTFPNNILADSVGPQALTGGTSERVGFVTADIVGDATAKTGLYVFDDVPELNLLAVPPMLEAGDAGPTADPVTHTAMLEYCAGRLDTFAVLDPPVPSSGVLVPASVIDYRNNSLGVDNMRGALYYPRLVVSDPLGSGDFAQIAIPPSGAVSGLIARVDAIAPPAGGVQRAPAGVGSFGNLRGVILPEYPVSEADHGALNEDGINAIRFLGRTEGTVVFGARTLSTSDAWRYINTRRSMTYIEQSILKGTRWAVFMNNDEKLWGRLTTYIEEFLTSVHSRGMLVGKSREEAFYVKIDSSTTTPADVVNGRLVGEIGVALQRPAEFVIFQFTQINGGVSTVTE